MMQKLIPRFEKFFLLGIEIAIYLAVIFIAISKALLEVGIWTALGLWIFCQIYRQEKITLPKKLLIFYGVFFLICIASFLTTPDDWALGWRGVMKWIRYLGIFFLISQCFSTAAKAKSLIAFFLGGMFVVTLSGFYQLQTGSDFLRHVTLDEGRVIRMKSSLGAPNTLAAFYLFAIPLSLIFFGKDRKKNFLMAILLIVFCTGFLLTFSRAAFLGLILASGFILLINQKWNWLSLIFVLIAGAFLISPSLYQNFLGSLNFQDITVSERLHYWKHAWAMIKSHPFLGIGLNLYHEKLPLYIPAYETYRAYAHNSFLQMTAEIGFVGLICFVSPLVVGIYATGVKKPISGSFLIIQCLLTGCLAFLIQAFFDNHFFSLQTACLFWIFWGLMLGLVFSSDSALISAKNSPF